MQGAAGDLQVTGQGERFAEQCAAFVVAAGVVRSEQPCEGAFVVVGAHPDRVREEIAFGLEQPTTGPDLPERQVAGQGPVIAGFVPFRCASEERAPGAC